MALMAAHEKENAQNGMVALVADAQAGAAKRHKAGSRVETFDAASDKMDKGFGVQNTGIDIRATANGNSCAGDHMLLYDPGKASHPGPERPRAEAKQ